MHNELDLSAKSRQDLVSCVFSMPCWVSHHKTLHKNVEHGMWALPERERVDGRDGNILRPLLGRW
jgi:hypothetical protein